MRYVKTENTILAGELPSDSTVKIKLINMQTDELLTIISDVCVPSQHIPGTYLWNTDNIDQSIFDNLTSPISVLYMMYVPNTLFKFKGKIVIGGELNQLSNINTITNQVKTNGQILTINQTELKTILNDAENGLPKLVSNSLSAISGISNIGTKIDNNFVLSSQKLDIVKSLVQRRKITFASSI